MQIRLATRDDVDAVRACARAAYAIYVERIGKPPAPMVADFDRHVARHHVYVGVVSNDQPADDTGEVIVGFVIFYPRDDHLHLDNIAVLPDRQGRGYGRSLITFVEAEARDRGFGAVELYTNEKMTENVALYPRLGYAEIDRGMEDGFNRVFYRKLLG